MIILSSIGWKSGLREWILQRFTGIYISFYFLFLVFYICFNGLTYICLINLFTSFYFKIITILFVFNIVLHSSIGLSIIITDYIKNTIFRIIIDFFVNSILLMYVFFIMQILWSLK